IRHPRALVVDDVFEDGAEALGGGVDLGLRLLVDADRLRVAAAFEVEDPAVAPSMLVVADQASRGLGGQGGLPGPAEAEEKRDVGAVRVRVGRAMHWEHALRREKVVERSEDRLLDLARISRA